MCLPNIYSEKLQGQECSCSFTASYFCVYEIHNISAIQRCGNLLKYELTMAATQLQKCNPTVILPPTSMQVL